MPRYWPQPSLIAPSRPATRGLALQAPGDLLDYVATYGTLPDQPVPTPYVRPATQMPRTGGPQPVRRGFSASGPLEAPRQYFSNPTPPPNVTPPTSPRGAPGEEAFTAEDVSGPGEEAVETGALGPHAISAPEAPQPPKPPEPTVTSATTAATASSPQTDMDEIMQIIARVLPQTDYMARAREMLPQPQAPERPEDLKLSPWTWAALLAPAALGALSGNLAGGAMASSAALRGLAGGYAQRLADYEAKTGEYRKGLAAYQKDLAELAGRLEDRERQRAALALPYVVEKAGERRRNALLEARLDLDRQTRLFEQNYKGAVLAFEEFKWANPSATTQLQAQLRSIDQAIRQAQVDAQKAYQNGRLEEMTRHNQRIEELTERLRGIQDEQLKIARDRVDAYIQSVQQRGAAGGIDRQGAGQIMTYYRFVLGKSADIRLQMSYAPPAEQARLQEQLKFFESEEKRLDPIVKQLTSDVPTKGPGTGGAQTAPPAGGAQTAPPAGVSGRPYQTKSHGTLYSSQIQDLINRGLQNGWSRADIKKMLQDEGIPADRFGL